jgi:hypothetical protein
MPATPTPTPGLPSSMHQRTNNGATGEGKTRALQVVKNSRFTQQIAAEVW